VRIRFARISVVFVLGVAAIGGHGLGAASTGSNAYFEALISRSEAWRSYSLREQGQLDRLRANPSSPVQWVTYDPTLDAAKVTIPDFASIVMNPANAASVATALSATDTSVVIRIEGMNAAQVDSYISGALPNGISLKIDQEIVTVQRTGALTNQTVGIVRGQNGTIPTSHPVGAPVLTSVVSLRNMPKLPLGTEDGHTYLVTWDALWTPSFIRTNTGIDNYKTWQFTNNDARWLQVDTRFSGQSGNFQATPGFGVTDVGVVGARSEQAGGGNADWSLNTTNLNGPNVTTIGTGNLTPQAGTFVIKPNAWTRYWVLIDQRAQDYDLFSMWLADQTHDPVQVFDKLQLSIKPTGTRPNSVDYLWLEYNTSTNALKPGRGAMTTYMRNFVALRDVLNPTQLMVRPDSAAQLPEEGPPPPTNLRILR
jgi:hypothetical protein